MESLHRPKRFMASVAYSHPSGTMKWPPPPWLFHIVSPSITSFHAPIEALFLSKGKPLIVACVVSLCGLQEVGLRAFSLDVSMALPLERKTIPRVIINYSLEFEVLDNLFLNLFHFAGRSSLCPCKIEIRNTPSWD